MNDRHEDADETERIERQKRDYAGEQIEFTRPVSVSFNAETVFFVTNLDPLTVFLYTLMRDYLPCGTIELIIRDHVEKADGKQSEFSNPHLATYAREIAERLVKPLGG